MSRGDSQIAPTCSVIPDSEGESTVPYYPIIQRPDSCFRKNGIAVKGASGLYACLFSIFGYLRSEVRRDRLVVIEFQGEGAFALGQGAQVG